MTPQFPHTTQQEQHRWLWPLIPSILAVGSFISTVDSASLAAAAECQVTKESGAIQGMTAWKGTRSRTLSPKSARMPRSEERGGMAARSEAEAHSLLVYKSPAWKGGVLYSSTPQSEKSSVDSFCLQCERPPRI